MTYFIILIIVALLAGIIYFTRQTPLQKETRERFLQKLAELVESKPESIEGVTNSFRINFHYEGYSFIYEDVEEVGFKDKVNKAFLRIDSGSRLNLSFVEKERTTIVHRELFKASEITESAERSNKVYLPKVLKNFEAFTNDPYLTNQLLEDKRIASVFLKFKNTDKRGYAFLSLKLIDGMVILEFHPAATFSPNILALHNNQALLEDYCDKLMIVVKKIATITKG